MSPTDSQHKNHQLFVTGDIYQTFYQIFLFERFLELEIVQRIWFLRSGQVDEFALMKRWKSEFVQWSNVAWYTER